jgi:hypothetical protein
MLYIFHSIYIVLHFSCLSSHKNNSLHTTDISARRSLH